MSDQQGVQGQSNVAENGEYDWQRRGQVIVTMETMALGLSFEMEHQDEIRISMIGSDLPFNRIDLLLKIDLDKG